MRINFGGDDPHGLEIVSRLATGEYLAYTKEARSDPAMHDRWTPGDPSAARPSASPGFHGPVVLLTGPLTITQGDLHASLDGTGIPPDKIVRLLVSWRLWRF